MKTILTIILGLTSSAAVTFAQVAIVDSNATGMGQANITAGYSQNFDSLPASSPETSDRADKLEWTHNETPLPGWFYSMAMGKEAVSSAGTFVQAPRLFNYGATGSNERAVGMRCNGNAKSDAAFAVAFINKTGKRIAGIKVSYTGEQWRWMGAAKSRLEFDYKVLGTGFRPTAFNPRIMKDWTRVDALDFDAPKTGPGGSRTDGNASENRKVFSPVSIKFAKPVVQGATFALRWYYPANALTGQGLAVDDLKVDFIVE